MERFKTTVFVVLFWLPLIPSGTYLVERKREFLSRYAYRTWVTNMDLMPAGVWHFYDGRAGMEPRICGLREDFSLRRAPTTSVAANALYLEIIRLAYTSSQRLNVSTQLLAKLLTESDTRRKIALQTFLASR